MLSHRMGELGPERSWSWLYGGCVVGAVAPARVIRADNVTAPRGLDHRSRNSEDGSGLTHASGAPELI